MFFFLQKSKNQIWSFVANNFYYIAIDLKI